MSIYKCINIIDSLFRENELTENINLQELKHLLYQICFESSVPSDMSFQDIDTSFIRLQDYEVKPIIIKMFPNLGYYYEVLNLSQAYGEPDFALGDSIDDLCDIIKDLSEVKWRIDQLGVDDAISYMRFIFKIHTESHILGLINCINELE